MLNLSLSSKPLCKAWMWWKRLNSSVREVRTGWSPGAHWQTSLASSVGFRSVRNPVLKRKTKYNCHLRDGIQGCPLSCTWVLACTCMHTPTCKRMCACVRPPHIYMHYAPMQNRDMDMPLWKSKTNHSRYFFFLKKSSHGLNFNIQTKLPVAQICCLKNSSGTDVL